MSRTPRPSRRSTTRIGIAWVGSAVCGLLLAGQLSTPAAVAAEDPPTGAFVDLGTATAYSVLAGAGVSNTGTATVLDGDLGLSPSGVIAGFPPGTTKGVVHDKDAAAEQAQADRQAAYDAAAAQPSTSTFAGDQIGKTFKPGVHTTSAAFTNTGTMTLDADGDSSAVFVFQVGAAFSSAAATKVVLIDGALANNVVWQVLGAVSLGADAKVVGTFLGAGAVSFGEGASLKGRALTTSTVALANSPVTEPVDDFTAPVVTIAGGPARSTNDTTPAIAGATDEPAGARVTVSVAGQTLAATVQDGGAWSVSADALAEGTHAVVASSTDGSRNVGTAEQALTVDVSAPGVGFDGGAATATQDTTPSISGSTTEPAGSEVRVTVAGQTLTTVAGAGGLWSVTAAPLTEDAHAVVASVNDAAGNPGSAVQVLTVDTTVPVVSIDGGSTASTVDTSPWIAGSSAEKAGTIVRVTIDGQDLQAVVRAGGGWSVSATALAVGAHSVVASVTDAAQNTGTATQALTVTPVSGPGPGTDPGTGPGTGPAPVDPETCCRPDAAVRNLGGRYVGVRAYASGQRVIDKLKGRDRRATFQVQVTNRGRVSDRLVLRGTPKNSKFAVTYLAGGRNVTTKVAAGSYRTGALRPGASMVVTVKVTKKASARKGSSRTFQVRVTSTVSASVRDTVAGVVRVVR